MSGADASAEEPPAEGRSGAVLNFDALLEEDLGGVDPPEVSRRIQEATRTLGGAQAAMWKSDISGRLFEQRLMKGLVGRSAELGPVMGKQLSAAIPLPRLIPKIEFPVFDLGQSDAIRLLADRVHSLFRLPSVTFPHDWFPETWEGLSNEDVDTAMAIVRDEGIPLVWVLRAEIVQELVKAAGLDARDDILMARRRDVAQDCLAAVGQVTNPAFTDLVDAIVEVVEALNRGLTRNAQALAANTFDTTLRMVIRRGELFQQGMLFAGDPVPFDYKKIRNKITAVSEHTSVREFRAACAVSPAIAALARYNPEDPTPRRFNRHSTAHRLDRVSYRPANAVVALMLAASLLREAEASGW